MKIFQIFAGRAMTPHEHAISIKEYQPFVYHGSADRRRLRRTISCSSANGNNGALGFSMGKLSFAEPAMMQDQVKSYCRTKITKESLDKVQEVLDPLHGAHVDLDQTEGYLRA